MGFKKEEDSSGDVDIIRMVIDETSEVPLATWKTEKGKFSLAIVEAILLFMLPFIEVSRYCVHTTMC